MISKPLVSLVMCTRNRSMTLSACLQSLGRLEADFPYELVLVDNGSSDNTAEILAEFAERHQPSAVLVSEPIAGVSLGRNAGIRAARADIIAFTDDDCYPARDFLTAILRCFQDKNLGYVGGRVLLFDEADLPITIQLHEQPIVFPPKTYMRPGLLHGANLAFRRDVLERIGGFDICLGPGTPCKAAEDTDLLQRASLAGYSGLYSPEPVVYHHHRRQTAQDEQQIHQAYSISRGAYFLKGLASSETIRLFYWPVFKRICGHCAHLRFMTFFYECKGAIRYWKSSHFCTKKRQPD